VSGVDDAGEEGAVGDEGFDPGWLDLREAADARARATDLVRAVRAAVAGGPTGAAPLVVHDLGCGTGSMVRWLAPRLPGPQRWVLHDRDPALLALAAGRLPAAAADGSPVVAETRAGDVTALTAEDLAGAGLVTASALLDLLTAVEVDALAEACAGARCPALFTLSVLGRVELTPDEPLDGHVCAAFDAHQRRVVAGRRLLGPDAVGAAAAAFDVLGAEVEVRPSPWRLGGADRALVEAWLLGWTAAAAEQQPDLPVAPYLERRLAAARAGSLAVTLHHADLLARWPA